MKNSFDKHCCDYEEEKRFADIKKQNKTPIEKWLEDTCVDITEESFYPPEDNRLLESRIFDTEQSTFGDFTENFNLLNDELNIYD